MTLLVAKRFDDGQVMLGCDGRITQGMEIDRDDYPKFHIGTNYVVSFAGSMQEVCFIKEVFEKVKKIKSEHNVRDIYRKIKKQLDGLGMEQKDGSRGFSLAIITQDGRIFDMDGFGYCCESKEAHHGSGAPYSMGVSKISKSTGVELFSEFFKAAKGSCVGVGGDWHTFTYDDKGKLVHNFVEKNAE